VMCTFLIMISEFSFVVIIKHFSTSTPQIKITTLTTWVTKVTPRCTQNNIYRRCRGSWPVRLFTYSQRALTPFRLPDNPTAPLFWSVSTVCACWECGTVQSSDRTINPMPFDMPPIQSKIHSLKSHSQGRINVYEIMEKQKEKLMK
jgi:hypothetical protein